MKKAVCDASLLVKLVITESDSEEATRLIETIRVIVPEFVFIEIGNVLWTHIRRGDIEPQEASLLLDNLRDLDWEVATDVGFLARSLQIATAIDHPIYDCLYVAVAEHYNVPLITADKRFVMAARRANFQGTVITLLNELA